MRDGRPQAPFGRRAVTVSDTHGHGAYRVLAVCDCTGILPAAGQFYMLAAVTGWGAGEDERPFLPRAFSHLRAVGARDGVRLEFLLEDVGPGTHRLAALRKGEELWLTGPLGHPFSAPKSQRALLVAGGVGLAPIVALQEELGARLLPASLLVGFRDGVHAAASVLAHRPVLATDDGSAGHHGLVTDLLQRELTDATDAVCVYACGPAPMLETVRGLCERRGVGAQLALEAGMACGFGACFGCVVPTRSSYKRVCVDGPVFAACELARVTSPTHAVGGVAHG